MSNPFDYLCERCGRRLSMHRLVGRQAKCDDQVNGSFALWQVVDARRALGHKITHKMSYDAEKSRADAD